MEQNSTLWSTLMWLFGGLLKPSNFVSHFIYFGFQLDSTLSMIPDNLGPALIINHADANTTVTINTRQSVTHIKVEFWFTLVAEF
eukprot:5525692-Ditylum_brightwellii.AAC.1